MNGVLTGPTPHIEYRATHRALHNQIDDRCTAAEPVWRWLCSPPPRKGCVPTDTDEHG
jgi:hypothetical protein